LQNELKNIKKQIENMYLIIGPIQIILVFTIFPIGIFLLGFFLGKKSGYKKRVKETEKLN
jgi:hypothetical protein